MSFRKQKAVPGAAALRHEDCAAQEDVAFDGSVEQHALAASTFLDPGHWRDNGGESCAIL